MSRIRLPKVVRGEDGERKSIFLSGNLCLCTVLRSRMLLFIISTRTKVSTFRCQNVGMIVARWLRFAETSLKSEYKFVDFREINLGIPVQMLARIIADFICSLPIYTWRYLHIYPIPVTLGIEMMDQRIASVGNSPTFSNKAVTYLGKGKSVRFFRFHYSYYIIKISEKNIISKHEHKGKFFIFENMCKLTQFYFGIVELEFKPVHFDMRLFNTYMYRVLEHVFHLGKRGWFKNDGHT